MKTAFPLCFLLLTSILTAQDYFSIVQRNGSVERNYPQNVRMTLVMEDGTKTSMEGVDGFEVMGQQALEIYVPWRDEPERLEANGDTLEVFVLPSDRWNYKSYSKKNTERVTYTSDLASLKDGKPSLAFKEIWPDEKVRLFGFSNGIVVRYENGTVRAWQDDKELNVTNTFLIYAEDYLLKFSMDPEKDAMWYVFEPYKR